ncbi:HNH endonuclease [Flammeovirga yaeyamensis]|uniref:HNH endonuclease n=1 Tax=Flammeovirga yaeyamensis TaxID=367791 RepID=A0AAX1N565_9BACT|nr:MULTISPECIES: hypothetical protein [Flammeovirga]ANQ49860.1 Pathogenesis-related transcriptional factor and ERF protein [Flammeovirga sp. MY04]MBB3701506.1 hypothetical protein [Flammeovirga yaeyamensis]NMF38628.1 Pathogenesis-related transcriptional factor and ERF protein [Flammeovirga yaeyamensis]QWG02709.1 HNH endonuclease [Flammeovirga yaeyamensis]
MLCKLKLKNSKKTVIVSHRTLELLENNPYLKELDVLNNLRIHTSGYVFFQRNFPRPDGKYKNVTIYLHRLIAEKLLDKRESDKRLFVHNINGNRLDLREENLDWKTMEELRRLQEHRNKHGYRGVIKVGKKFKAIIYENGKRTDLGNYPTIEEASEAYEKRNEELYGNLKKPVIKKRNYIK